MGWNLEPVKKGSLCFSLSLSHTHRVDDGVNRVMISTWECWKNILIRAWQGIPTLIFLPKLDQPFCWDKRQNLQKATTLTHFHIGTHSSSTTLRLPLAFWCPISTNFHTNFHNWKKMLKYIFEELALKKKITRYHHFNVIIMSKDYEKVKKHLDVWLSLIDLFDILASLLSRCFASHELEVIYWMKKELL